MRLMGRPRAVVWMKPWGPLIPPLPPPGDGTARAFASSATSFRAHSLVRPLLFPCPPAPACVQELDAILPNRASATHVRTSLDEQRPLGPLAARPSAGAGGTVGALALTAGQLSTARLLASIAVEPPVLTRGALPGLAALVLKARRGSPSGAAWDERSAGRVLLVGGFGSMQRPACPNPPQP